MGYSDEEFGRMIWSNHVLRRMAQRRISKLEVRDVLLAPTFEFSKEDGSHRRLIGTSNGRRIAAVVVSDFKTGGNVVVTAWAPDEEEDEEGAIQ